MSWTVADIKTEIRGLTGRRSTSQLSEADLLNKINNYYRFIFPQEVQVSDFEQLVSFNTVAGVNNKLISDIDSEIINVSAPVYIDGDQITFTVDDEAFFQKYPTSETAQSKPDTILLYGDSVYLGPIPDDVYTISLNSTVKTPSAFTLDTETPADEQWGAVISYGVAIEIFQAAGDNVAADELKDLYSFHKDTATTKRQQQRPVDQRSVPRF